VPGTGSNIRGDIGKKQPQRIGEFLAMNAENTNVKSYNGLEGYLEALRKEKHNSASQRRHECVLLWRQDAG